MNDMIKQHFFKSKLQFKQCNSFIFLVDHELEYIIYARLFFQIFLELFPAADCYLVLDQKYHFLYADFKDKLNIIDSEKMIDVNVNLIVSFNVSQARILNFRRLLKGPFLAIGTETVAVKGVHFFPIRTTFHPIKLFFKCFDLFEISLNTVLNYIQLNKEKQLTCSLLIDVDSASIQLSDMLEKDSKLKGFSFRTASKHNLELNWEEVSQVDCVVTDNPILAIMASVRGLFVVGVGLHSEPWGGSFITVKDSSLDAIKVALLDLLHEDYDQPLSLPYSSNNDSELFTKTLFFGQAHSDFVDYLIKENISFYSNIGFKEYISVVKSVCYSRYKLIVVGQISGDIVSFFIFNSLVSFLQCICFLKRIKVLRVQSEFELKYKLAL
tara:strand:- start:425 stop:1570 length:1146 start_codon:yes stop_codon:yes gene_type:complete